VIAIDLQPLIGRLGPACRQALEAAVGATLSRTHYNVEVEHWFLQMLDVADSDLRRLLRHLDVDPGSIIKPLTRVLDRLKTGNSRPPALSPDIVRLIREGCLLADVQFGERRVRSGHLLIVLLADDVLGARLRDAAPGLARASVEGLRRDLPNLVDGSPEAGLRSDGGAETSAPRTSGVSGALDLYTVNLTERVRAGKIDPIIGRDAEIRQVIDVLMRRRQNNPILTGEAGVGKTAVVEGFAQRIVAGEVPPALQGVAVHSLDLGLLQAGAGMKGEFENRLKSVIEEIKASPVPIITFIDEAHTLIGAGGAAGQNDAANLLKPALARGEMRTVAATTWAEYKKYFERDPALTRRFQVVKVEEPSEESAVAMMRALVPVLARHHKVRVHADALTDAVRLSKRYIPARQLPDKAVSLLDTACARVAMSQGAVPEPVEDARRTIEMIDAEIASARPEEAIGRAGPVTVASLEERRAQAVQQLAGLELRWEAERALVARLEELRVAMEGGAEGLAAEHGHILDELASLQGEQPLVRAAVDGQAVAEVVAAWTGIPVGRMVSNEIRTILGLKDRMRERVIGQDHALATIVEAMWTSRAGLTDPRKPIGVFLLAGTSGVGKTETALALADMLYGGEQNMTTIAMSEFKEEHKISMLVGSPPGYVGFGEGGVLTEAVRRRPYSVVLLDEIEKAHPGVQDVFFQVFDKGSLRDGEGRDIDFRNTVIILTTNAGTETISKLALDPETMPEPTALAEAIRPELLQHFKPAFLGRTTVIPYMPLGDEILQRIVELNLARIRRRVASAYGARFEYEPDLVRHIAARCREAESGARNVENITARTLLPRLSELLLARLAHGETVNTVRLSVGQDGAFAYELA
jgi:type VI secretion system protein VasG